MNARDGTGCSTRMTPGLKQMCHGLTPLISPGASPNGCRPITLNPCRHYPNGRFGFVRLPTEIEWEYAARGGHQVPADQMMQEAYFPLKNRDIAEYAVFTQANAAKLPESVAWIGTKCANPLGLFDTAGNASEMMFEPFRFSLHKWSSRCSRRLFN